MGYATDEDRADFTAAVGDTDDVEALTPEAPPPEEDTPDEGDDVGNAPVEPDEPAAEEQAEEGEPEPTFTVMVDGQAQEVPQSELLRGYSRQADYTRKVQLLAAQRRQLADADELLKAMDRNPRETLSVLARWYGVEQAPSQESYDEYGNSTSNGNGNGNGQPKAPTPEERRLQELEAWQQAEVARQREVAVDNEIARLHHVYGEFEDEDLFGFAVERDIRDLETALRAMQYGRAPAPKVEKRKVAGMAGGSGRSGAAVPKADTGPISSFRDAYDAAKRELARS